MSGPYRKFLILIVLLSMVAFPVPAGAASLQVTTLGWNKDAGKWAEGNVGSYPEGGFVGTEIWIHNGDASAVSLGIIDFAYSFFASSAGAIGVDYVTNFRYSTTVHFAKDGTTELPGSGWNALPAGQPSVFNMPLVGSVPGTSEDQNAPALDHYWAIDSATLLTATGGMLPAGGDLAVYFQAHLAETTVWSNGQESTLPSDVSGHAGSTTIDRQAWTKAWMGAGSFPGSSLHGYLVGFGSKSLPVPSVGKTAVTVSTVLSAIEIGLGNSVTDTAIVSGKGKTETPTGTVEFKVQAPGSTTWTTFSTKTLSGGQAVSESFTPTKAGTYYFKAVYGGDGNYSAGESPGPGQTGEEKLIVTPITPAVVTNLSLTTAKSDPAVTELATWNGKIYDIVTITKTDDYAVTGEVAFQYCKPGNDTAVESNWVTFSTKTLEAINNGEIASDQFQPSSVTPFTPGVWHFRAWYKGNTDYYAANKSGANAEPLTVPDTPGDLTVRTGLSKTAPASMPSSPATWLKAGDPIWDWVTVTGAVGYNVSGTITFQYLLPGSDPAVEANWHTFDTKELTTTSSTAGIASAQFNPWTTSATTGLWRFRAKHGGNSNYAAASSPATGEASEPLTVLSATVSTTLAASEATSPPTSPPSTATTAITLGQSVYDYASITGVTGYPVGQKLNVGDGDIAVVFEHLSPATGATWTTYSTKTLGAGDSGVWSGKFTPDVAGAWKFRATYSGSGYYPSAASGNDEEPLTVGEQPEATVTTTLSLSSATPPALVSTITIGTSVFDHVTVTGTSGTPTGTVDFQYAHPGSDVNVEENWHTFGSGISLTDGKAVSGSFAPDAVGTWHFRAKYSGNDTYAAKTSAATAEPLIVSATPQATVTTVLSQSPAAPPVLVSWITKGASVYDHASVTGTSGTPTGLVNFQCAHPGSDLNVEENWHTFSPGTLTAGKAVSGSFTPDAVGTWYFRAKYLGDTTYGPATSVTTAEPLVVFATPQATVTTILSLSPAAPPALVSSITRGTSVYDHASVIGTSGTPAGYVNFQYAHPGSDVNVEENWHTFSADRSLTAGKAVSGSFTPDADGTWYFRAKYFGDSTYGPATSATTAEPLAVGSLPPPPPPPPPPPEGTTITLEGSGSFPGGGYDWTIAKRPNPVVLTLQRGQTGTVTYTIDVTKAGGGSGSAASGSITVTNTGSSSTQGLQISAIAQYKDSGGVWHDIGGASWSWTQTLAVGASTGPLSFSFSPVAGATNYQVMAGASITNYSGYGGTRYGPSKTIGISAGSGGGDDTAVVTDVLGAMSMAGFTVTPVGNHGPWTMTNSGSITFTVQIKNDSVNGPAQATLPNTATLVEQTSGVSRQATARVTVDVPRGPLPITGGNPLAYILAGMSILGLGFFLKRSR